MKFLLPLLLINAFATAAEDSHDLVSQIASNVPLTKPVEYTCSLVNLWTQERHPRQYPGTSAHWSPAVLVSHSDAYQLWANGSMATRGIEQVAETGSVLTLLNEIDDINQNATNDRVVGSVFFNSEQSSDTLEPLVVDARHPYISSISMIAPSPDWFSGLSNFDARDSSAGTWLEEFTIETYPFDAGTETGNTYSLSNPAENPQKNITQLTIDSIPKTTKVFADPGETIVQPVARWVCNLVIEETEESCLSGGDTCTTHDECCSKICIDFGPFMECGREIYNSEGTSKDEPSKLYKEDETQGGRGGIRGRKRRRRVRG